ncbi:MAG: hypothetical protein PUC18_13250 [Prevotellaceae bacterium]|nr:hypothetical protein [Prevotellaceae bacterium]
METDAIYLTIRVDFEYDERHDEVDVRREAASKLTSFLSSAILYEKENGLRISDVEVCDINEE